MINRIAREFGSKTVGHIIDEMTGTDRFDLIRDCINYQRQLANFGVEGYGVVLSDPGYVFNMLIELSVDELQAFNLALSSACRKKALSLCDDNN